MKIEDWTEHHQFYLWATAVGVSLYAIIWQQLRSVLKAIPHGWTAVVQTMRVATLSRLEEYQKDPGIFIREWLFLNAAYGVVTLIRDQIETRRLTVTVSKMSAFEFSKSAPSEVLVQVIYVHVHSVILLLANCFVLTMYVFWLYRWPLKRIGQLRRKLARTDS